MIGFESAVLPIWSAIPAIPQECNVARSEQLAFLDLQSKNRCSENATLPDRSDSNTPED